MIGLTDENEAGIDAINAALIGLRQTLDGISAPMFRGAAPLRFDAKTTLGQDYASRPSLRFDAKTHCHTHHVGDAPDGELLQNPRAMNLDGARTDTEAAA